MKIRTGFVSNSSSSSFVIVSKPISWEEVKKLKKDENIYAGGPTISEGEAFFHLTKDMIDYLKKESTFLDGLNFHRVYKMAEEGVSITGDDLKEISLEGLEIWSNIIDQHQPRDLEALKELLKHWGE